MLSNIHKISGISVLIIITSFFLSSIYGELNGNPSVILKIKTFIVATIPLIIILMPTCAITGKKIVGKSKNSIVKLKNNRIKFIAFNGVVLITLAVILYQRADDGMIDQTFLMIQFAELFFGLTNMVLLGLMIRDGRILTGKIKQ